MSKTAQMLTENSPWGSLQLPKMAPEAPVKEPKTAPPPTKPSPATPTRDPVGPGERPDPREQPVPQCPPSTCPAP